MKQKQFKKIALRIVCVVYVAKYRNLKLEPEGGIGA